MNEREFYKKYKDKRVAVGIQDYTNAVKIFLDIWLSFRSNQNWASYICKRWFSKNRF